MSSRTEMVEQPSACSSPGFREESNRLPARSTSSGLATYDGCLRAPASAQFEYQSQQSFHIRAGSYDGSRRRDLYIGVLAPGDECDRRTARKGLAATTSGPGSGAASALAGKRQWCCRIVAVPP